MVVSESRNWVNVSPSVVTWIVTLYPIGHIRIWCWLSQAKRGHDPIPGGGVFRGWRWGGGPRWGGEETHWSGGGGDGHGGLLQQTPIYDLSNGRNEDSRGGDDIGEAGGETNGRVDCGHRTGIRIGGGCDGIKAIGVDFHEFCCRH